MGRRIVSGIYQIKNLINGHIYIGSSDNIKNRWSSHKHYLNRNSHHSHYLQNAWNKYGVENFEFSVLEYVSIEYNLLEIEQYYIDWMNPDYNMCQIAGSVKGIKFSEERKKTISDMQIQKWKSRSQDERLRISNILVESSKEYWKSPDARTQQSERRTRYFMSPESRIANSMSQKKRFSDGGIHAKCKKIICVETGKIYSSGQEAYRDTGIDYRNISAVVCGKRKTTGGFHWRFYEI